MAVLVSSFIASPSFAQGAGDRADPGRIEQRIEDIEETLPTDRVPPLELPATPEVKSAGEDQFSFLLSAVVVEGNTRFPASDFIPFYEDLLATQIGRKDAEAIASRITNYYRDQGYLLSWAEVPPQSIGVGVLRVRVVEGYVARTTLSDSIHRSSAIDSFIAKIEAEQPLSQSTLERNLLLIEDLPGISINRSTLAVAEERGAFLLSLEGEEDSLYGLAYFDNRGTPEAGRLQTLLTVGSNNALGFGEQFELDFYTIPDEPKELLFFSVSGALPVGNAGTSAYFEASQSFLEPGASLASVNSEGDATHFKLGARHPVVRSRAFSAWIAGQVDFLNVDEDRNGMTFIRDRLRIARGLLDVQFRDDLAGATSIGLEVSHGLDLFGASEEGDANLSRSDGDPQFTKFKADVVRFQNIYGPFQLRASASAQIASAPLLSSEEFDVGGSQFGRAYDFSEISGDHGVAGSLELRLTSDETEFGRYQIYSFVDGGAVWQKGSSDSDTIVSAGLGLRWLAIEDLNIGLEFAAPINKDVESATDRDVRVLFSILARF